MLGEKLTYTSLLPVHPHSVVSVGAGAGDLWPGGPRAERESGGVL